MSDKRKLGPMRQLSLQTDTRNRPILKKQLSVEQLDAIDEHKPRIRGIESAKNKLSDRPRPVRVAWAENRQSSCEEPVRVSRLPDPVDVKKCKEFKRPTTAKHRQQPSIEKESILYTRQELAERLRKAWKDREENKQNLDIFLTHNVDNDFDDTDNCYTAYDRLNETKHEITEIVNVTEELNNNLHHKIVQKPVIKSKNNVDNSEFTYVPSRSQDIRTNISVTIPSVQNSKLIVQQNSQPDSLECIKPPEVESPVPKELTRKEHKLVKQLSLIDKENENCAVKNLPPRPSTAAAASKRESFQKRTNTAFNGSLLSGKDFRAPLTRTLSVPVKSDINIKPKFISTKRRLKTTHRKGKDDLDENSDDGIGEDREKNDRKKGSRCKSAPGGEVVTMVSLVSPAGSDTEELPECKKPEPKSRSTSPIKPSNFSPGNSEPPNTIQLRKTIKSVSFQQSSIHTVRSFSASFPSRRGSMAAALNTASFSNPHTPEREKRAPLDISSGESRGPKRRLLRSNSATSQIQNKNSFEEDCGPETNITKLPIEPLGVTKADISLASQETEDTNKPPIESPKDNEAKKDDDTIVDDPETPKFETTKEKECWLMYKKMSDKGFPIAFDTILRGMLTPTEYRSVRKEVAST